MEMNFKLKTLVAALALSAVATSANAAISSGASNGNSEFVFSAWDSVAGVGYTYDLNWDKAFTDVVGIDQATTVTGNALLAANAVVQSSLIGTNGIIFDGALTGLPFASASNVQWNLGAFDNAGRTRLLMTQGDSGLPFVSTNNQVKAAVTLFGAYTPATNGFITAPADDTYAVTNDTNGNAYAGSATFGGNNFNGNLADTSSFLGASANMYFLAPTTQASSAAQALQQQLFSFDGKAIVAKTYLQGNEWRLQVAAVQAVPEPETNAMMLAGLGLMGFIARRRRNNLAK
jgi:hypothetical protein